MSIGLSGKTVVVTGAAAGIGAALCESLVGDGARVVAVDRQPVAHVETSIGLDFSDPDSLSRGMELLPDHIDALACVAGVAGTQTPNTILRVNFFGQRELVRRCLPKMPSGGAAVFVSSITAHRCDWSEARLEKLLSSDENAALRMLAEQEIAGAAAYELSKRVLNYWLTSRLSLFASHGVRANLVSPGPVRTSILKDFEDSMGRDRIAAAAELVGRHGEAGEIASVLRFLLSEGASWVNGQELKVDGGFHTLRAYDRGCTL
ncbi:MAG: coniferyl-alcohol dehydrogenase [Congregibacter sp.]